MNLCQLCESRVYVQDQAFSASFQYLYWYSNNLLHVSVTVAILCALSTDQIETSLWERRRSQGPCRRSLPGAYRCPRDRSQPPDRLGGCAGFAPPHLPSPPSGSSTVARASAGAPTAGGNSPAWQQEAEWATPGGKNKSCEQPGYRTWSNCSVL